MGNNVRKGSQIPKKLRKWLKKFHLRR